MYFSPEWYIAVRVEKYHRGGDGDVAPADTYPINNLDIEIRLTDPSIGDEFFPPSPRPAIATCRCCTRQHLVRQVIDALRRPANTPGFFERAENRADLVYNTGMSQQPLPESAGLKLHREEETSRVSAGPRTS